MMENSSPIEILNTIDDLNKEFKNLLLSIDENDIKKMWHYEIKIKSILRKLIDGINISEVLSDCFLQIKFGNRYNFYHKNPATSLANFRLSVV